MYAAEVVNGDCVWTMNPALKIDAVHLKYSEWKSSGVCYQWENTFIRVRSDWWQKRAHVWPSHD